jgi:hypothetical protein
MIIKTMSLLLSILCLTSVPAHAEDPGWSPYRTVVNHVKSGSKNDVKLMLADYPAVRTDVSLAKTYEALAAFDPKRLSTREERLAFYINAYSILTLKMAADQWPIDSIKAADSLFKPVWDRPAGQLGGKTATLSGIEHAVLRPMGEPGIHLAIVCASVSCPDLRDESYAAAELRQQLDDQAWHFLSNPEKGLAVGGSRIRVSKIFAWYENDFAAAGGVAAFIGRYRPGLPDLKIDAALDYDWSANSNV